MVAQESKLDTTEPLKRSLYLPEHSLVQLKGSEITFTSNLLSTIDASINSDALRVKVPRSSEHLYSQYSSTS